MTFIPMIRMAITQYGHNCNIQEDIEYQSMSEMYLFCLYQVNNGRYYARIIGWGIRFKLQMLCPQEDMQ